MCKDLKLMRQQLEIVLAKYRAQPLTLKLMKTLASAEKELQGLSPEALQAQTTARLGKPAQSQPQTQPRTTRNPAIRRMRFCGPRRRAVGRAATNGDAWNQQEPGFLPFRSTIKIGRTWEESQ